MPLINNTSMLWGHKAIFYTSDEKVEVEAPSDLIRQLVLSCDGSHTIEEVVHSLGEKWDSESVYALIEALRNQKVIVDAQCLSGELWKVAKNPSYYPRRAVDKDTAFRLAKEAKERHKSNPPLVEYKAQGGLLGGLLSQRRSNRGFTGNPVAFQKIVNVIWSAYGICKEQEEGNLHRTVASAGALYPLKLHVVLFKKTEDLEPAIYQVYLGNPESVGFHQVSRDITLFSRSFLVHPSILKNANGVIIISGSLGITGEKYGNRSMLYVPLEAGYVAQNIHLSAIENGVATVELGGFADNQLAESLKLQKDYHPLTTIVFGERDMEARDEDLYPDLEFQWAVPTNDRYKPPFAIASARASEKRSWSHGRDVLPELAFTKAISEAKEWAACGCISETLVKAKMSDVDGAIDPRDITRFHSAQYKISGFPFKQINPDKEYEWTMGYDAIADKEAYILADLVYFPYFPETPYYAYANSSGVAAHPNRQKAIELGTLELVERDSFMIVYLARLEMPTLLEGTLPLSIRERIIELRRAGFQITIKDHSLDLAPVVCVLAQSEEHECTACASCSSFDIEHAVSHALMEVEAFVLARLENGKTRPIKPADVGVPLDHGQLYDQRQYFHNADHLISSKTEVAFCDIGKNTAKTWDKLLSTLADRKWPLITIPLTLSGKLGSNGDLHIIRSIVPGTVPMTFGYRQEPAGTERIYTMAEQYGKKNLKYRELTKFPHPYA